MNPQEQGNSKVKDIQANVQAPGATASNQPRGGPEFHYTVIDVEQETTEHQLTANQILSNAGFDPSQHYLVLVEGQHKTSYENKGGEYIQMHNHMKFLAIFTGPTPVS